MPGTWDLDRLFQTPSYQVLGDAWSCKELLIEGETFNGKPTKFHAFMGLPYGASADLPVPGVVLNHGGGGKAFHEWIAIWNSHGYASIAMDFGAMGPEGKPLSEEHLGEGYGPPPGQGHEEKFKLDCDWEDLWTYHAVSQIIRSHSVLASLPGVDANRIGMTGVSWGGYLTSLTAGVDHRFKAAIPVYGCGFLQEGSAVDWMHIFSEMTPKQRDWWHDLCDPSVYIRNAKMPICYVNGTNDFAYPMNIMQKTAELAQDSKTYVVIHEMGHSHEHAWANGETPAFMNSVLQGGDPLAEVGEPQVKEGVLSAEVNSKRELKKASLLYTLDSGLWQERKWIQVDASLMKNDSGRYTVLGDLKEISGEPTVVYLNVIDDRRLTTSSKHLEL